MLYFRCNFPGCSKGFANKYNVKRHIENVHLKLRRKSSKIQNKSDTTENKTSSNANDMSDSLNISADQVDAQLRSAAEAIIVSNSSSNESKRTDSIDTNNNNSNNNNNINSTTNDINANEDSSMTVIISNSGLVNRNISRNINKTIQLKSKEENNDEICKPIGTSSKISNTVAATINSIATIVNANQIKLEQRDSKSAEHLQTQKLMNQEDVKNSKSKLSK